MFMMLAVIAAPMAMRAQTTPSGGATLDGEEVHARR